MNKPYLIQRCLVKGSDTTSVDTFLSMDYMGSAEFEFGALPQSLKRITSNLDEYQSFKFCRHTDSGVSKPVSDAAGRQLHFICTKEAAVDVGHYVDLLLGEGCRLKERSYLQERLRPKPPSYIREDLRVWWEIDNDYFITLGEVTTEHLMEALKNLRTRWKREGKIA